MGKLQVGSKGLEEEYWLFSQYSWGGWSPIFHWTLVTLSTYFFLQAPPCSNIEAATVPQISLTESPHPGLSNKLFS